MMTVSHCLSHGLIILSCNSMTRLGIEPRTYVTVLKNAGLVKAE